MKLPKSYIKKYGITKEAWRKFKAARKTGNTKRKSNKSRASSKSSGKRNMGKKKRRRRNNGFKLPLAPIAGIMASQAVQEVIRDVMAGRIEEIPRDLGYFIGYDAGRFRMDLLAGSVGPIIIGALIHKFVGGKPLNLNQTLAQAGVPFVRI